jgi:hypothetical protein
MTAIKHLIIRVLQAFWVPFLNELVVSIGDLIFISIFWNSENLVPSVATPLRTWLAILRRIRFSAKRTTRRVAVCNVIWTCPQVRDDTGQFYESLYRN